MMNCNHNCGGQVRMPGLTQPPSPPRPANMNQRTGNTSACASAGQQRTGGCVSQASMSGAQTQGACYSQSAMSGPHHHHPHTGPGPVISDSSCGCSGNSALSLAFDQNNPKFPVGMGYVPWQNWETPYPMAQALNRGTIFSALDLPFMMGRCRR